MKQIVFLAIMLLAASAFAQDKPAAEPKKQAESRAR